MGTNMFKSDFYYCIGSTHHFCQDFAVSGDNYAIVSDGCSSAKSSEIGAMLVAKAAEQYLNRENIIDLTITAADVYRKTLGLQSDCLCATLLTITTTETGFLVHVSGDGVIVAQHKELGLIVHSLEYSSGAPFYAKYNIFTDDYDRYLTEFPGDFCVNINGDNTNFPIEYGTKPYIIEFPFEEYDLVGIMSDGIKSFYTKEKNNTTVVMKTLPPEPIIKEMFAFKGFNGEFVKRRCLKALRTFKSEGIEHYDDFSIAVIMKEQNEKIL